MAARRPRDFLLAAGLTVGALAFGAGTRALAQGTIPGLTSTPIYARAEVQRFGDVGARVKLICAVSGGVPNAAENPKLVLEAPDPVLSEEGLSKGGWTNCAIDDTKTKLECTAGSISPGASLEESGVIFYAGGLFTLTCTSDTPQILPSPDGFDFGLIGGLTPLSQKTVNTSQRSQQ